MTPLEWTIKVLTAALSVCAIMFVAALIFSPEFRDSSVSNSIAVILGAIGAPLGAIATGAAFTRGMRQEVQDQEEKTSGESDRP